MNTYTNVVNKDLCISCRACAQICPLKIVSFDYIEGSFRPKILTEACDGCGLCLKVCPSYKNDLSCYTKKTIFCGSYFDSYMVYSNNKTLRANSSSGGVVTNMLISLLAEGEYQKTAVVL